MKRATWKYTCILFLLPTAGCSIFYNPHKDVIYVKKRYVIYDSIKLQIPSDSSILICKVRYNNPSDTSGQVGFIKIKEISQGFFTDVYGDFIKYLHSGSYHITLMDLRNFSENNERIWDRKIMSVKVKLLPQHIVRICFYKGYGTTRCFGNGSTHNFLKGKW